MMAVMEERQNSKWVLEEKMIAVDAPTIRKEAQPTVGDISVAVDDVDKEDDDKICKF